MSRVSFARYDGNAKDDRERSDAYRERERERESERREERKKKLRLVSVISIHGTGGSRQRGTAGEIASRPVSPFSSPDRARFHQPCIAIQCFYRDPRRSSNCLAEAVTRRSRCKRCNLFRKHDIPVSVCLAPRGERLSFLNNGTLRCASMKQVVRFPMCRRTSRTGDTIDSFPSCPS